MQHFQLEKHLLEAAAVAEDLALLLLAAEVELAVVAAGEDLLFGLASSGLGRPLDCAASLVVFVVGDAVASADLELFAVAFLSPVPSASAAASASKPVEAAVVAVVC